MSFPVRSPLPPNLLLTVVFLQTTSLIAGDVQFRPEVKYSTGRSPQAVVAADFNRDGNLDLAVATSGSTGTDGNLSILLGNGDGTFHPRVDYPSGIVPGWGGFAVQDLNGDGFVDIVTPNQCGSCASSDYVEVLLGNGDGSFQSPLKYATGKQPAMAIVADLNGDGVWDLATANYGPSYVASTISVLLGNGDGSFRPHLDYAAGVNPTGFMPGDFNRDGKVDFAVMNNNPPFGISVLLGNGDGSFKTPILYASGGNPRVGVVDDFNGDGNQDLATAHWLSGNISIWFGRGDGTFNAPVNYQTSPNPNFVISGDFKKDGSIDLLAGSVGGKNLSLFTGSTEGLFSLDGNTSLTSGPGKGATGDFDGDGYPDVAVTLGDENAVGVLLQATTCKVSIQAVYENPDLKIQYRIGNLVPGAWRGWLVTSSGTRSLWAEAIDVFDPPVSRSLTIPNFPPLGEIGLVAAITQNGQTVCVDATRLSVAGATP